MHMPLRCCKYRAMLKIGIYTIMKKVSSNQYWGFAYNPWQQVRPFFNCGILVSTKYDLNMPFSRDMARGTSRIMFF
jgi:hypothetical protein